MKKKLLSAILLIIGLSSCANKNELNILVPTGAPSFAFYNYVDSPCLETNSSPKNIIPFLNSNSEKDIVVIDTVSGIQAINKTKSFKIAATITFGNFYLASTGNDDNNKLDVGDNIVLFGKDQNPDLIFHYLYGNQFDSNIEYVSAASDSAKCLITGKNSITGSAIDYVFLAQPALYNALNKNQKASLYEDIQKLYKEKTGVEMIQASLFVNNNTNKTKISQFLSSLEKDINDALVNPTLIETKLNNISIEEQNSIFGSTGETVKKITENNNQLGLGYKSAYENKKGIDTFLKLFNIEETNEEIYFK